MAGSVFGNYFTCTAWGDAYTQGIGAVVDGVPAGLKITENDIQQYLNRRRVWAASVPAKRHESDFVTIASGLENGITTGGPVSLTIMNSAVKEIGEAPVPGTIRPGQGDIAMAAKYGATSEKVMLYPSRIQSAITAAGAIAVKILREIGVSFCTYVSSCIYLICELFGRRTQEESSSHARSSGKCRSLGICRESCSRS